MSQANVSFFVMQLVDGNKIALSRQEVNCLTYLTQGFSYCSTGKQLSLSPRTVEFYVGNIRAKSGYQTKEALLTILNASRFNEQVQSNWFFSKNVL